MMNGKELNMLANHVAREKGLTNAQSVIHALEEGLSTSIRRQYPQGTVIKVVISPDDNQVFAYRQFDIVDTKAEITDYETQILKSEVQAELDENPRSYVASNILFQNIEFSISRQQYNVTRQVAIQNLTQEIKEQVLDNVDIDSNTIYNGVVKITKKDAIVVELKGRALDIVIPRKNLLGKDRYKVNDHISFVIDKVNRNNASTTVYGSRRSEKFLMAALEEVVGAIKEGKVEIVQLSRIPGFNAKVIVRGHGIDPIRACAPDIKKVASIVGKEFVDLIAWDENPSQLLINALSPIVPIKLSIDEEENVVDVVINSSQQELSKKEAYVKHLENLFDFSIKFFVEDEWEALTTVENARLTQLFVKTLDVDEEFAQLLVDNNFLSVDEIVYSNVSDFADLELDEDTISELKTRAKDFLEKFPNITLIFDLGFSLDDAITLIQSAYSTINDVADMDSYELNELLPHISIEEAGKIIMKARNTSTQYQ